MTMASVQDRGAPSTANIVFATAIVSGLAGYYLGQARSIGLFGKAGTSAATEKAVEDSDISDLGDSSDDDDVQDLGEIKSFADSAEECKLVLVVRNDLGMTKGE
jgi:peptidyl-tRNA hydrolase, PTH2 family